MKLLLALLTVATWATAACPTYVGRPETYPVGSVVAYNGSNYEVIRDLGNGWITPSDPWFWSLTSKTCAVSSSSSIGSSSSSAEISLILANQATIIALLQELKEEHAVIRQDIAKLSSTDEFTDSRDGQVYPLVKIATQTWMAKNLNFAATASKCYQNSDANCAAYGRLYDWATAKTSCPTGWHLPSDVEWTFLEAAVGGNATAGNVLKATGLWNPYTGIVNSDNFGFSALPGGANFGGSFSNMGYNGFWWTSTSNGSGAYGRDMYYGIPYVYHGSYSQTIGFSVRCIKD
jgi:uncharacterized protein (TIGR02145 family)